MMVINIVLNKINTSTHQQPCWITNIVSSMIFFLHSHVKNHHSFGTRAIIMHILLLSMSTLIELAVSSQLLRINAKNVFVCVN